MSEVTNGKLRIVIVEPNEEARVIEISDTLEDMQETVGGYIEQSVHFEDDAVIVCDEEGKLKGLPLNRAIKDKDGNIIDVICGVFFICYAPYTSEKFESLSEELAEKYVNKFKTPEMFIKTENGIVVLPME